MRRSVALSGVVACLGFSLLWSYAWGGTPGSAPTAAGEAGLVARAGAVAGSAASLSRELLRGPLATLSDERLAQRYTAFSFMGVSQAAAERLFAGAVAAVYAEAGGRLVLLASPAYATPERLVSLLTLNSSGTAGTLPQPQFQQSLTLPDFATEIDRELPGLGQGTFGRHVIKMPVEFNAPPGFELDTQPTGAPAKPDATVFSENFEGGISSSIWQLQSATGNYTWGATTCTGPGTGKCADAVRGGTNTLSCSDVYPPNQMNWMVHKNCENFSGAAQAWLQMHVGIWTTNTKADSLSVLYPSFAFGRYIGFWHAGSWTPAWTFYYNLKQWEGIGDLTTRACNQLIFVFMSDDNVSPPPPGYGARVDDISIFTGSNPPLACSVSADTTWGAAPLTVHFTGTWSGGSGQTFVWDFADGGPSAEQNPTHVFLNPGEYDSYFEVYLSASHVKCEASLHVTAHGGGDDICSGATAITANSSTGFSTVGYTRDQGITTDCTTEDYATGATRWFKFTATQPGYGVADLCGSAQNPFLTLFSGSCGALTWLHCYDTLATCPSPQPPPVPMQPGDPLYFQVARRDDVGAATTLNFTFAPCTVGCTANVPATGSIGSPVSFAATSTPTNCPLPAATYSWTFGDSNSSTQQNPQHTYTTAGAKSWAMTATINGVHCQKNGTITISALPPGDVSGDGVVNVGDVFYLINTLFAGGPAPVGSGDVNGDHAVNVQDVFYLINYLFAGGPAPV